MNTRIFKRLAVVGAVVVGLVLAYKHTPMPKGGSNPLRQGLPKPTQALGEATATQRPRHTEALEAEPGEPLVGAGEIELPPTLSTLRQMNKTVLRSAQDEAKYQALLASPELVNECTEVLAAPIHKIGVWSSAIVRITAIKALEQSGSRRSGRSEAIAEILNTLLLETEAELPWFAIQSRRGDLLELGRLLKSENPSRLQKILNSHPAERKTQWLRTTLSS